MSISCLSVSKNRGFVELVMNQCSRRRSRECDFPSLNTQSENSTYAIFPLLTRRVKIVRFKCQLCNFRPFEIRWWPQCSSKTKNPFLYTPEYICVRCWQKRSGEIRTTKNPSTKMSISFNSYAGLSYWSCCSKCVLKNDGCMIHELRDICSIRSDDMKMTRILASTWAHGILLMQAEVIGRIF